MTTSQTKTAEERRALLSNEVTRLLRQGRRVESQSDYQAVLLRGKKVNHILHLLLSVFTAGLWLLVWLSLLGKGIKRELVQVDEWGKVTVSRL